MDIGACLEPATGGADPHRAYTILKRWHRNVSERAPNPSQTDIEKVRGNSRPSIKGRSHTPWTAPGNTHRTCQGERQDPIGSRGGGNGLMPTPAQCGQVYQAPRGAL